MENLARRSIYVLAALTASMLCWFALSSEAQATSHYTTKVKDGCTLRAYAPYTSSGRAYSLTTIKCNSTKGVKWAHSYMVRDVNNDFDQTVASKSFGDSAVLRGGQTYYLTASYACNTTADRYYHTEGKVRLDSWTLGLSATSPHHRLTNC